MKYCHQCGTSLPDEARYCLNCGAPQISSRKAKEDARFDLRAPLEPQLRQAFFRTLRQRLEEEQPGALPDDYIGRLHESGFGKTVERRLSQLAEEIPDLGLHRLINRKVDGLFEELLDYFIIRHCSDLNPVHLPDAILKYPHDRPVTPDLYNMVLDFLDLSREDEDVYLYSQFVAMPAAKLRNAGGSFLFPEKDERIFLICDQSLLGSCKEGFAFTDRGLYWRAHLQKPQHVPYDKIAELRREKDWITINGHFFNANPGLNVKVLKLMKRLKEWFLS